MTVKVLDGGFEGHVRRSLARGKRGERLEPETAISFSMRLTMVECLSNEMTDVPSSTAKGTL